MSDFKWLMKVTAGVPKFLLYCCGDCVEPPGPDPCDPPCDAASITVSVSGVVPVTTCCDTNSIGSASHRIEFLDGATTFNGTYVLPKTAPLTYAGLMGVRFRLHAFFTPGCPGTGATVDYDAYLQVYWHLISSGTYQLRAHIGQNGEWFDRVFTHFGVAGPCHNPCARYVAANALTGCPTPSYENGESWGYNGSITIN